MNWKRRWRGHPTPSVDDRYTKKQAEIKLKAISNKIGYPDKWRDYSKLKIQRDNLLADFFSADEFESARQWRRLTSRWTATNGK